MERPANTRLVERAAADVELRSFAEPRAGDQSYAPVAPESFATKMSPEPAVLSAPPPKSMALSKLPVTAMFPVLSTATPVAFSQAGPVTFDHMYAPVEPTYLATKSGSAQGACSAEAVVVPRFAPESRRFSPGRVVGSPAE